MKNCNDAISNYNNARICFEKALVDYLYSFMGLITHLQVLFIFHNINQKFKEIKMKKVCLFVSILILVFGCQNPTETDNFNPENMEISNDAVKGTKQDYGTVTGEIGPGSSYLLAKPENWNGNLVLYTHGYVEPEYPIQLPEIVPIRDFLLMQGFGVAYSSYSENGWAIKDALVRTRQLIGLFNSNFGKPTHTYIIGNSIGGLVAVMFAEKNPNLIDGVLSICSPLGGSKKQIDQVLNVRVLFDYYFPYIIPGTPVNIPEDLNLPEVFGNITIALVTNIPSAIELASVDQADISYANINELIESIVLSIAYDLIGMEDLLNRAHDQLMVDNSNTIYTINGTPIPYLNDPETGVTRYEATNAGIAILIPGFLSGLVYKFG